MVLQKYYLCQMLYINIDNNICQEDETSVISITIKVLRDFYTPIQILNYKILFLSCWF